MPLRPWSEWWAAALTILVRTAVQAPIKIFVGANVLIYLIFQKFILFRAIRVEYGHPSSVRDYLSGHVLHRIQCNNISLNHVFLIVNISVIYLL